MKIVSACIYSLNIPFAETFSHHLSKRHFSNSIVVKVTDESGVSGFGEGIPRPYVTGETQESSVRYILSELLPRLSGHSLAKMTVSTAFDEISGLLPAQSSSQGTVWNSSLCAVELALIDCFFKLSNLSIASVLPPVRQAVTYSGVIDKGNDERFEKHVLRCKNFGLPHIKIKVSGIQDVKRIERAREILGPSISIRLDANAAFDKKTSLEFLNLVAPFDIACIEQPLPRANIDELSEVKSLSPVPIMVDESIVTPEDCLELIEHDAAHYLNIRISKCGGIRKSLAIYETACKAGMKIQLGCQVGESAILSAAGRHLAAHLENIQFVEGSYGLLLLKEDLSREDIGFGYGGTARLLEKPGLGIDVHEERLDRYAENKHVVPRI